MPAPPCNCCGPRSPWLVEPIISAAGRAASGVANGSWVADVGQGSDVVAALLDGSPLAGSDYDGRWQSIVVIMAVPVSQLVPGDPEEEETEDEWVFRRWEYDVWTRDHIGDPVLPRAEGPHHVSDQMLWDRGTLASDESVRVPDAADPADFDGVISRIESDIIVGGQVTKVTLEAWVDDDANWSEWLSWSAAAEIASAFLFWGVSAGTVFLEGGYEESDHPGRVDRIVGAYAGTALAEAAGGIPPMMARDPGPTLRTSVTTYAYDHQAGGSPPTEGGVRSTVEMPWHDPWGWSSAEDLADPEADGWAAFGDGAIGEVEIIEWEGWTLDMGPMVGR